MQRFFHLLLVVVILLAALSAPGCKNRSSSDPAEYAVLDSIPCRVEVNKAATARIVRLFPKVKMFAIEYPEWKAVVKCALVLTRDSDHNAKITDNQLYDMGVVAADNAGILPVGNGKGIKGWIFSSPPAEKPIQMLLTDSASVLLHARMEFTSAQTDTAGFILPAMEIISRDLEHMAGNLH